MPVEVKSPTLEELLFELGEAGLRMSENKACEGAAGNISIYVGWPVDPTTLFPVHHEMKLPFSVPELAGNGFLCSGSGQRLSAIHQNPKRHVGYLRVNEGGETGELYFSADSLFSRLTIEFTSHLHAHSQQVLETGTKLCGVIHAQPPYLTYLSHLPRYQDQDYLNLHLLRWQPETIVFLPEGIGVIPFAIPGSQKLVGMTEAKLKRHHLIIWSQHGVIVRADSLEKAADLIEYVESSARYEYMNLINGEQAEGFSVEQLRLICDHYQVQQTIFI